ncbi:MAG TPA: TIGR02588 family protein [Gemmatimonadales bacterium]
MAKKGQGNSAPVPGAPTTSLAEWIVAILSAALVLGVLGFLLYDGIRSPRTAPEVTVEVDSIQAAGPGYLVLFRARNTGRSTAAEVVVEGELESDTGKVETSETTIDYVPAEGEQRGGLFFRQDPRRLRLKLRAHGYREP